MTLTSARHLAAAIISLAWTVTTLAAAAETVGPSPEFDSCKRPEWPLEALRHDQQGTTTLAFLIGVDGKVVSARLVKSSGFPLLDAAAEEGIRRCSFRPARQDGEPVQAWMQMAYVWTLTSPASGQR